MQLSFNDNNYIKKEQGNHVFLYTSIHESLVILWKKNDGQGFL